MFRYLKSVGVPPKNIMLPGEKLIVHLTLLAAALY